MTGVEQVLATSVSPGDYITEIDTPAGPWYTVLSLGEDCVTVDGSHDPTHPPLPVSLPVGLHDLVLRRRPPS
jgi:hypothetical protein